MAVRLAVIAFSFAYAIFEVYPSIRQSRSPLGVMAQDKGSLRALYTAISIGYTLAFFFAFSPLGRVRWHPGAMAATGGALILTGLLIRVTAIKTLGSQFTRTVQTTDAQVLVDHGLYRHIRHPGYLGQLLLFLGVGLALTNWLSMIGIMAPVLWAYQNRIKIEEAALTETLGDRHREYVRRTSRLLPWLY